MCAGAITAGVLAAGAEPPAGVQAVGWTVALIVVAVWVAGFVSLARGPLDVNRRLPWALAMIGLPVLGACVWFWWRHRYYPARRAEQPGWDPNAREQGALPPPRTPRLAPRRRFDP